jgi:hypothetical protein
MIELIALVLGLVGGLIIKRQLWPLLFEHWLALPLIPVLLAACLLPTLLANFWPGQLWTADRSLLISLLVFPCLIGLLLVLINCLPRRHRPAGQPPTRWYHRIALLIVAVGLVAEAAVLLLNHGYMPIPESYLSGITDAVVATGIRNQAFYLKQLIGPQTVLPWLGQIWRWDWLTTLHLSPFPYISPAQVVTAAGLFLTGISQFYGEREIINQ